MARCFVIGPIGDIGTQVRADADDFMKYIVTPVVSLKEFDYDKPIRADSLNEPGRITSQIVTLLLEAELVIADLTTNNPNVFYELSLRHAVGKPVIHMATEGTPLSFDVRDNRTIFYTMHSRSAESARAELLRQIRHVRQDGYKAMNPILETVGIISLEKSSVPEKEAIGQLMVMIERLSGNVASMQEQMRHEALMRSTSREGLAISGFGVPSSILGSATTRPQTIADMAGGSFGILNNPTIGSSAGALSGITLASEELKGSKPKP